MLLLITSAHFLYFCFSFNHAKNFLLWYVCKFYKHFDLGTISRDTSLANLCLLSGACYRSLSICSSLRHQHRLQLLPDEYFTRAELKNLSNLLNF